MSDERARLDVLRRRALAGEAGGEARALATRVAALGGDAVRAILFFGSRKTQARPASSSAYDFFVVVDDALAFYRALHAAAALRRSPRLLAALDRVLTPNQLAVRDPDGGGLAKCAVISLRALARETSERRRDHFVAGRLFQPAEIVHHADEASLRAALEALAGAQRLTYRWARPFLPPTFDVEAYTRTLLRVSFAAEIRPEPEGRADLLWQAQRAALLPPYALLLEELARAGELQQRPGGYALARPAGSGERLGMRFFFARSKLRATLRWAKHVVTFDDWLEFILGKVQRHTGRPVELTPRERRHPLLFLWPRVIRYLRHKDGGGA
jgi:hypothetical protein